MSIFEYFTLYFIVGVIFTCWMIVKCGPASDDKVIAGITYLLVSLVWPFMVVVFTIGRIYENWPRKE